MSHLKPGFRHIPAHRALALLAAFVAASSPLLSQAEELRTTRNSISSSYESSVTSEYDFDSRMKDSKFKGQLVVDPVTGEVIKGDGKVHPTSPSPSEPEPEPKPFDYFDNEDDGSDLLDSYFLAQLSMNVYSVQLNEQFFLEELQDKFGPQGIAPENIEVRMHDTVGTELAMFVIGDAVVFAFRGTSDEGTKAPDADMEHNMDDMPRKVTLDGKDCRIHRGYWNSTDAVYDWVLARAIIATAQGKKIFLTGHSLGGARATVTAARLLYNDDIPVYNLQTFGSPKVGDAAFGDICATAGADDIVLWHITDRWVVMGDPATTFFEGEWVGTKYVKYFHVGHTHTMIAVDDESEDFEIAPNSGEIPFTPAWWQYKDFFDGIGDSEHMWYDDALLDEIRDDPAHNFIQGLIEEFANVVQNDGGI